MLAILDIGAAIGMVVGRFIAQERRRLVVAMVSLGSHAVC